LRLEHLTVLENDAKHARKKDGDKDCGKKRKKY